MELRGAQRLKALSHAIEQGHHVHEIKEAIESTKAKRGDTKKEEGDKGEKGYGDAKDGAPTPGKSWPYKAAHLADKSHSDDAFSC